MIDRFSANSATTIAKDFYKRKTKAGTNSCSGYFPFEIGTSIGGRLFQ